MQKIDIDADTLRDMYIEQKLGIREIGDIFGCTGTTIAQKLGYIGIARRKRRFTVNEHFFKEWTPEMAYLLGYITADGHVRNERNTLTCKSIDYEILEYLRQTLRSTSPIKEKNNGQIYCLDICSKQIITDLNSLGIHNRKSLTIKFPEIPEELFWHYLRGEIDGDGHIISKAGKLGLSIVGSYDFITTLIEKLHNKIGCTQYVPCHKGKAFGFQINGIHAYHVLKYTYENNYYGLSRKKDMALRQIAAFDTPILCTKCGKPMLRVTKRRKYCSSKCKRK